MTSLPLLPIPDDDLLPIAALNDLLFCERRCALHRIEQVWVDNVHTVEGTHGHKRADLDIERSAHGVRSVRAILLQSRRLGLVGKADVVEFHRRPDGAEIPFPVEYKRGKRRRWDNDEVQLCAQALCLEEMLGTTIPAGAIFHIKSKRRREIRFTPELRDKTEETARRLHELVAAGVTPPPVLMARCRGCSLHDLCLPELFTQAEKFSRYSQTLWIAVPEDDVAAEAED
jgi:CRISPR-associated exonuclease Cas4